MTPNSNQEEPNKIIKILTRNFEVLNSNGNNNKLFGLPSSPSVPLY